MPIHNNTAAHRFELEEDGHTAFADYRLEGNVLHLPHVEAPPALRGTGAAGRLMQGVVDYARLHNLKLRPICGYAVAWLRKHPDTQDVVL